MDKCIQTSPHLSSDEDFSVKYYNYYFHVVRLVIKFAGAVI